MLNTNPIFSTQSPDGAPGKKPHRRNMEQLSPLLEESEAKVMLRAGPRLLQEDIKAQLCEIILSTY